MSLEFLIDISHLAAALGSTWHLNISDHQEYFLGDEGGWCSGLTASLYSCANCLKLWDLAPPGTLRACNRPVLGLLYLLQEGGYDVIKSCFQEVPLAAYNMECFHVSIKF